MKDHVSCFRYCEAILQQSLQGKSINGRACNQDTSRKLICASEMLIGDLCLAFVRAEQQFWVFFRAPGMAPFQLCGKQQSFRKNWHFLSTLCLLPYCSCCACRVTFGSASKYLCILSPPPHLWCCEEVCLQKSAALSPLYGVGPGRPLDLPGRELRMPSELYFLHLCGAAILQGLGN